MNLLKWEKVSLAKEYLSIFAIYLGIVIYLTFPLIMVMDKVVIAATGEMSYWQAWYFWWFKYALTELHTNPVTMDYQFFPNGLNMLIGGATLVVAFLSIPLQFFLSPTTNLNIFYFLSFPFSGLGMYILLKYLTGNRFASFMGGMILAFNPQLMYSGTMNHLHTQICGGIPLYVLSFIKMIKEENKKAAIAAGLWLTFNAINYLYFAVFCFVFSVIYWIYFVGIVDLKKGVSKKYIKLYLILIGTFAVTDSWMIFYVVKELFLHGDYTSIPIWVHGGAVSQSADMLGFFLPSFQNYFLGSFSEGIMAGPKGLYNVYLGYTIVALSAYIVFKKRNDRDIRFWGYSFVLFAILSLGPVLHFHGRDGFNIFGYESYIYLPGYLTYYIPLLKGIRGPIAYGTMTYVSLSVLTGYAISHIFGSTTQQKAAIITDRKARFIMASVIFTLISFEYIAYPRPFIEMETPKVYDIIGKDKEVSTLLELPFGVTDSATRLMWGQPNPGKLLYYQITHKKKVFHGIQARIPKENFDFYFNAPVISSMFYINQLLFRRDMPEEQKEYEVEQLIDYDKYIGMKVLRDYNVKYITLYPPFSYPGSIAEKYVTKVFNVKKIADIDDITLYEVQR